MGKDFDKTLGETLRNIRQNAGLTQIDAAKALGVRQPVVSRWENGTQTLTASDLLCVSTAYQTPVTAFYAPIQETTVLETLDAKARKLEKQINRRNRQKDQ